MTQVVGIVGRGQPIEKSLAKATQTAALFSEELERARQMGKDELNSAVWFPSFGISTRAQQQRQREIFEKPRRKRRKR